VTQYTLQIIVQGLDQSQPAIKGIEGISQSAHASSGMLQGLFSAAAGAFAVVGAGAAAAAVAGFSLNNAMEQTTARINAFTKDGAATAGILDMIRDRAAKTPFEFNAMAEAAASLLPAAKTSGKGLEDLISTAEILAASNPAEGLVGAAFSLKEALSGDFVSIVERFNLPRQRLNELKDQGVPAIDAIRIAMQELGLDSDLVSNLAETASGRWSTFKDTLQGLAATVTKPIFDMFSAGLGTLNTHLEGVLPQLTAVAAGIGQSLAGGIQYLTTSVLPALWQGWQQSLAFLQPFIDFIQANAMPILVGLGAVIATIIVPALFSVGVAVISAAGSFLLLIAPLAAVGLAAALLYQAFQTNFLGLADIIQPMIDAVMTGFGEGGIGGALTAFIGQLGVVGPQLMTWFMGVGEMILIQVGAWAQGFLNWITPVIEPMLIQLGAFSVGIFNWIVTQAPLFVAQLVTWGAAFVGWIAPYVSLALTALAGFASGIVSWIVAQAPGFVTQLVAWGSAFIAWIGPMIPPALAALGGLASSFFSWIAEQAAPILAGLSAWAQSFIAWIPGATVQFLAEWPGMLNSFLDWIGSAVGPLLAKLGEWAIQFVAWIAPMIPGFIVAVAGIATALTVWIGQTVGVIAAKVLEWGAAFLGWVATEVVPKLPGILDSIKTSVSEWISTGVGWLSDEAKQLGTAIIDGVKSGISGAVGALTSAVTTAANSALAAAKSALGIKSPSSVMAAQVGVPIVDGIVAGLGAAAPKLTSKMLELAGQMVDLVSKGADAFGKLRELGTVSFSSITQFANTLQMAMNAFAEMAMSWNKSMQSSASQFALKASTIVETMAKGIDFLLKLQQYQGVPNAVIVAFGKNLGLAILELIKVSTIQMRMAMGAAVEFSLGAGKVIEILGKGVDALAKLATFTQLPTGVAQAFAISILWVVKRIAEVAGWIGADAVAAAARFAEGAGKVIGIIGAGIDGFVKLATFTQLPAGVAQAFALAILSVVTHIAAAAGQFAATGVAAAARFAEGAGKVVAIIGAGVDGVTKLGDFGPVSTIALDYFANAIANVVARLTQTAGWFDAESVAAAAVFADGAGKMLGIISNGVAGLRALGDLGPVSQAGLDAFAVAVGQLMTRLTAIAGQFSVESVQAAGAFSDAAGKAVGILKNGIEGLLLLNTFTGTSVEAMTLFGDGVRLVVAKMAQLALEFGTDAIAAATAFATAAGQSTDFLKKGVEGFLKLADFKAIPQEAMNLFAQGVVSLVNTIIGLSNILTTETLAAANTFSNAIDTVITLVLSGLKGLSDLGNQAAGLSSFTDALVATVNQVAAALVQQARPTAMNIGLAISYGIADGIAAGAGAIQNAIFAAVNAALAAARAALGIASPSKVFKDQIGIQMSAGMAEGVLGGMGGVQAAVGQVSSGALGTSGSSSTTNNNQRSIVFQPGAIVIGGSSSPSATADAVVTEINRRLGMQGA
jgi:hypothetical protein